jgi:hypothetical protein
VQTALPIFVGEVTAERGGQISLPPGGVQELGWAPGDELLAQVVGDDVLLVLRRPAAPRSHEPTAPSTEVSVSPANHTPFSRSVRLPIIAGAAEPASEPTSGHLADGLAAGPGAAAKRPLNDPSMSDPAANALAQLERLESRIVALERLLARLEASEGAGEQTAAVPTEGASAGPGEQSESKEGTSEAVERTAGRDAHATSEKKPPGLHLGEDDVPAELILRLPKAKQFMRELARDILQQMLPDDTTIRWR